MWGGGGARAPTQESSDSGTLKSENTPKSTMC